MFKIVKFFVIKGMLLSMQSDYTDYHFNCSVPIEQKEELDILFGC